MGGLDFAEERRLVDRRAVLVAVLGADLEADLDVDELAARAMGTLPS